MNLVLNYFPNKKVFQSKAKCALADRCLGYNIVHKFEYGWRDEAREAPM